MTTVEAPERTVSERSTGGRIKHIRTPEDPNRAFCGHRRKPGSARYTWDQIDPADICVICASYPGALEYARSAP